MEIEIGAVTLTFIPCEAYGTGMVRIEAVSFDMEGTLIDNTFSDLIWETDIPLLYGQRHGLDLETARARVLGEYAQVGDDRSEWYDTDYWFRRLELPGDWRDLLHSRKGDCRVYPEVQQVLERLSGEYPLIISSNTIRGFLEVQLKMLPDVFVHVFSATSDFGVVKKSEEFYSRMCRAIGVEPQSVVHVGDSMRFDFEAARQAGIHSYHLDRAGESEGENVVHDLVEFEQRLKELSTNPRF
jgi:FMN phosphatase YigB (HAD superfamily)